MSNLEKFIKEKQKEIKQDPGKIFGLVYPYVLIIGLIIGLIYLGKINFVGQQQVPPPLPDSTNTQVELTIKEPRTIGAIDLSKVTQPADSLIKMGQSIFQSTCTSCHGSDGKGDGPVASALNPPPRNFTSKENWINGPKLSGIFQTLQEGIKGSAMVAYEQFSPLQKFALAHYIRSTFVPDPPPVNNDDLADLDQHYNLSKGTFVPGQIPVAEAEKLIVYENQTKVGELAGIMEKISKDENNSGVIIFRKVINDESHALTILLNSDTWKNSEQEFVNLIINNVYQDGFNSDVLNLSDDEWTQLYDYMKNVFV
ncbi:MAG TPA: cytochrome c [Ignavibacteriaceae bacterium]|nr:cytochrome c [Ignavibacteriaceae bacterium]